MKVEVAVLGSPSLIILTVSVDVKQHLKKLRGCVRVEVEVSPGLPVPRTPYGLCGGKATFEEAQRLCESGGGRQSRVPRP